MIYTIINIVPYVLRNSLIANGYARMIYGSKGRICLCPSDTSAKTIQIGSPEHVQGRKAEKQRGNVRSVSRNSQCSLKHLFTEKDM